MNAFSAQPPFCTRIPLLAWSGMLLMASCTSGLPAVGDIRLSIRDDRNNPRVTIHAAPDTPVFLLRSWELVSLDWLDWDIIDAAVIVNGAYQFHDLEFRPSGWESAFYRAVEVPAPTNLTAALFAEFLPTIVLSWVPPGRPPDEYVLERANAGPGGMFEFLDFVDGTDTTYEDFDICLGTTHQYRLTSVYWLPNSEISSRPSEVATLPLELNPPANLSVERLPNWTVQLNWSLPSTPVDSFVVERSINGGPFQPLSSPAAGTETNYVDLDEAVAGADYCYRVRSEVECATTVLSAATGPVCISLPLAPPTGLSVVRLPDCTLQVQWTPPGMPVEEYAIERAINDAPFAPLDAFVEGSESSFIDDDFAIGAGARFCYRLTSRTSRGSSSLSEVACITLPYAPPVNVSVSRTPDCNLVVQWTAAECSPEEFVIERSINGGEFVRVETALENSFDDPDAVIGGLYTYRVRATNDYGESPASSPSAPYNFALNPPQNVTATVLDESTVRLNWAPAGPCIDGYMIYATECGRRFLVDDVGPEAVQYVDLYAHEGSPITYTIMAYSSANEPTRFSPESNPATATPPVLAPDNLVANNLTQNRVVIYWDNNSFEADEILIFRAVGSGPFTQYGTAETFVPNFTDASIKVNNVLRYQVRASVSCGQVRTWSNPSAEASILAPPVLQSPANDPNWVNRIPRPVTLNWSDVAGATGGYRVIVEYWPSAGGSPQTVVNKIVSSSTYTPTSAEVGPGRRYSWRIRALSNAHPPTNSPETEDRYFVTRTD